MAKNLKPDAEENQVIRFDWAIKTLLRHKANFDVLEGFLSAVLREEVRVEQILESESNQEAKQQKHNRVDILVTDSAGRRLIIEVQNERETDYLERLLFGTSKVIVENLNLGAAYHEIFKVISISILYFNLGAGDDYVYYGGTEFRGLHTHQLLTVREKVQKPDATFTFQRKNIFPEYYLINVERFEDVIENPLDEWIYMLKHSAVPAEFRASKIDRAREKLALLNMKPADRKRYERYIMDVVVERDIIETARADGWEEGREKGIAEGMEKGIAEGIEKGRLESQKQMVITLHQNGFECEKIVMMTGLDEDTVRQYLAVAPRK